VPVLADGFASGQIVSGKVVSVDQNEVVVDLGDRQGVINRRHLTLEGRTDPTDLVTVGEELEAAVLVREDPKNRVVLSRTWAAKQRAWQAVDASTASGEPLRGKVVKVVKGGVLVDIGVRAFLPVSQLELRHVDNLGSYVGRELDCLVAEADRTTDKIVLTRRSLLRRLDRQRTGELMAGLSEGQTLKGVVTRLADYGAFVRVLDRIEGLVHVSELAEYRVHLPEEVVIPGDEVMVKVLRIDRRRRRVDLSVNQAVQYSEASPPPGPDAEGSPGPPATVPDGEAASEPEISPEPETGGAMASPPETSTGVGPAADAEITADADITADAGPVAAEPAVEQAEDDTTEDR